MYLDQNIECFQGIALYYEDKAIYNENEKVIDFSAVLVDFAQSNKIRIMKAFEGDSLVWEEPVPPPIYVPDRPIIPPWVNENVQFISEELTYVDGEWVNLELIDIIGD